MITNPTTSDQVGTNNKKSGYSKKTKQYSHYRQDFLFQTVSSSESLMLAVSSSVNISTSRTIWPMWKTFLIWKTQILRYFARQISYSKSYNMTESVASTLYHVCTISNKDRKDRRQTRVVTHSSTRISKCAKISGNLFL